MKDDDVPLGSIPEIPILGHWYFMVGFVVVCSLALMLLSYGCDRCVRALWRHRYMLIKHTHRLDVPGLPPPGNRRVERRGTCWTRDIAHSDVVIEEPHEPCCCC
ncbi:hypothetical protein BV898_06274 [Hypsibius exemplaris]|uniref:Uncharacterized protein n=1 Tax=Hypsibius exemplaris TaxID=2072580 RepID=A0A1W0WX17_HYPEX|nr:hypothetical protein BV898_06274 [Hypsibius exemplaris]